MHALDRKLVRDLWHMKGQAAAISLVMACGVGAFVMSLSTQASLEGTLHTYYERYRFADVFAHVKRAPNYMAERLAAIPDVSRVQTRIVVDVTLDVPGLNEPAVGRIISVPDRRTIGLNDLHLRRGRYVEPGRPGEVLASEAFAEAHNFQPGHQLSAVINGKRQKLTIVGVALSPEYVYSIRPGEILPDDQRFGVFWMAYTELAAAFDMEGAFNDISLALLPDANEAEVLRRVDELTEEYGGLGAYTRKDQLSHKLVNGEIEQLRGMALIAPTIFLSVSAFLLNVVLTRLIGTQREQIAAIKAFGYSRFEIGLHYLKFVLVLVVTGTALGLAIGAWLGKNMTELYTAFFRFPIFQFWLDLKVALLALVVSAGATILGTYTAVRKAVNLPPAEAMRPEPPADFRPTFLERTPLQRFLSPAMRMILRQLERQPIRSALTCLGIALATAVLILGNFVADTVDYVLTFQFSTAQRHHTMITFTEPTSAQSLYEVQHLPGVTGVEAFRSVPARVRSRHHHRRLGIMGLTPEPRLFRLMNMDETPVRLPPDGLVISEILGRLLDVKVGDSLIVEVLEAPRPTRTITITGMVSDFGEPAAYMSIHALHRLMGEGDTYSGAFLAVDTDKAAMLYQQLKQTPQVASVNVKEAAIRSFEKTFAENLLRMRLFNVMFASVIAFGVVYNSASISLSERSRELATLRVLGFTRGEISTILLGELATLTVIALPLGMIFGYWFSALAVQALETEAQRFPLVIYPSTYGLAVGVTLAAAVISGLAVRRRLDHLDLVAVLKSRE
jgi:putative ABC transport system permease protein